MKDETLEKVEAYIHLKPHSEEAGWFQELIDELESERQLCFENSKIAIRANKEVGELQHALRAACIALLKISEKNPPPEVYDITVRGGVSGWWDFASFIARTAFNGFGKLPDFVTQVQIEYEVQKQTS